MSENHVRIVKNLDEILFDDAGETPAELRKRLEAEGVDVTAMIARVRSTAGKAYREALTKEANKSKAQTAKSRGSVFGDLTGLSLQQLVDLVRAAASGRFGAGVAARTARCRNQEPENLSKDDLRTLLEDIESTVPDGKTSTEL